MAPPKIPRKVGLFKPCLPLIHPPSVEPKKTDLIGYSLWVNPEEVYDGTYKKTIKKFSDGEPLDWIQVLEDLAEVFQANEVEEPRLTEGCQSSK